VLARILPALQSGQIVAQTSTVSATWTMRFAEQVHGRGASYLDCPFTGSKPAAEQRQTVFYVGGDKTVLDRARSILTALSKAILHVGGIGAASSLKLAMNVNIALVGQALCESLALARRAGIDDATFFDALKLNASRSGIADLKEPKLRSRDWSPQFSVKHMAKDLRLALETAGNLPLSQARKVLQAYEEGLAQGWGDEDFAGLMRLVDPA
jgi:3-hydroxyisobutyrate dehydrogenase-like beta-hydroxyacid dehydrogenase